jgi:hypothetical protein
MEDGVLTHTGVAVHHGTRTALHTLVGPRIAHLMVVHMYNATLISHDDVTTLYHLGLTGPPLHTLVGPSLTHHEDGVLTHMGITVAIHLLLTNIFFKPGRSS